MAINRSIWYPHDNINTIIGNIDISKKINIKNKFVDIKNIKTHINIIQRINHLSLIIFFLILRFSTPQITTERTTIKNLTLSNFFNQKNKIKIIVFQYTEKIKKLKNNKKICVRLYKSKLYVQTNLYTKTHLLRKENS